MTSAFMSLGKISSNWWHPYFSKFCGALWSLELGWACSLTTHTRNWQTMNGNCHLAEKYCWTTTGHCWQWVIVMNAQKTVSRKKVFVDINKGDIDGNDSVRKSWDRALKTIQPKLVPAQRFTWGFSCFASVFISILSRRSKHIDMVHDYPGRDFTEHYNRKWNVGQSCSAHTAYIFDSGVWCPMQTWM
jgi:hypothetical protein